jgi:hypothetical protein
MFKVGDRVITNENAFKNSTDPQAETFRGVTGVITSESFAFDWEVEIDKPVDGVETTQWHVLSDEIDKIEE